MAPPNVSHVVNDVLGRIGVASGVAYEETRTARNGFCND